MSVLFGISLLPDASPSRLAPEEYFRAALAVAKVADEGRLQTVKITEHYLHAYGGYCPSPVVFLAAVAAITSRIRLMTGCILPAFHNPIQMAAETAMLDCISGGRLDVGFARAYLPYEFAAFGVSMDDSREIFFERIATVIELWKGDLSHIQLGGNNKRSYVPLPPPAQAPHPPIWAAAVLSPQSFAAIGEHGFNLLVNGGLSEPSRTQDLIDIYRGAAPSAQAAVAISVPLVIRKSHGEALAAAEERLQWYLKTWADAASSCKDHSSPAYPGYAQLAQRISAVSLKELMQTGNVIAGDPRSVLDQTQELLARLKVDQVLWQLDFGSPDQESMLCSLDLFLNDVLPSIMTE